MNNKIFLIGNSRELSPMEEQRYDSEKYFKICWQTTPIFSPVSRSILITHATGFLSLRRWAWRMNWTQSAVVVGPPVSRSGWSANACRSKRSTDSRIRREVVGQMLDYAANAILYWPPGAIENAFEETCRNRKLDPAKQLVKFRSFHESTEALDADDFWKMVQENLKQKKSASCSLPMKSRRTAAYSRVP